MRWIAMCLLTILISCGGEYDPELSGPETEAVELDEWGMCCKICRVGKACGDTCINEEYECHVGEGCACDAN